MLLKQSFKLIALPTQLQITVRGESNNFTVDINGAKMPINHLADGMYIFIYV